MVDLMRRSAEQAYNYITEQGVVVPDTSEILEKIQQEWRAALGEDLSLEESTPQGRLIEMQAIGRATTLQLVAQMANMMNPNLAFGMGLDALAAFSNTTRSAATKTRVLVQLTGVPNTNIPANTTQGKTNAGDIFYLENDLQLDRNGTGQAYFLAQEAGPIVVLAGELNQIVSGPLGLETINNGTNGEAGAEQESDASLREKRLLQLPQGAALLEDYMAALSKVPNIRGYMAFENYDNEAKEIQGVMVNAHSVYVIADGGEDQDVAEAIFKIKSAGCGYTGTESVFVVEEFSGVDYEVKFNRPTLVNCKVSITARVTDSSGTTTDIESAIKNAVLAWQDGSVANVSKLNIGSSVSPFEISAAVSEQIPALFISDVKIAIDGEELGYNVIPMAINQRAVILEENISVEIEQ